MHRVSLMLLALLFTGCAARQMHQRMDPLVGVLTYDESIAQMGVPTMIAQGESIIVAEWRSSYTNVMSTAIPNTFVATAISVPIQHGTCLRLVFRRADGVMTAWDYKSW